MSTISFNSVVAIIKACLVLIFLLLKYKKKIFKAFFAPFYFKGDEGIFVSISSQIFTRDLFRVAYLRSNKIMSLFLCCSKKKTDDDQVAKNTHHLDSIKIVFAF